jgi:PAT family beta-lactamase induction signal transducer AmpG
MSQLKQIDKQNKKKLISNLGKLGSSNFITNFIAYITGTIGGPVLVSLKKMVLL